MLHKRKCVVMLIVTIALLSSSCFAYADTVKVPMDLVVSPKVIDVSVTEKVNFSAGKGSANASVSDITVRNNAANSVYLLSAAYGGDVSPWTLVSNSTNFASMGKNQNKYSLTADGQDLKSGSKDYSKELAPSGSYTIKMNGKTGLSTKAVSGQRGGTVVLTVGLSVPPKIVSWAAGTDEEIASMVAAAERGEINLRDYWHIGDMRNVHLEQIPAQYGYPQKEAMDVKMILGENPGGDSQLATIRDRNFPSFTVFIHAPNLIQMARHDSKTVVLDEHVGSDIYSPEKIYSWLNNTFQNSMSLDMRNIFAETRYMIKKNDLVRLYTTNIFRPLSLNDCQLAYVKSYINATYTSETWFADYYDERGVCLDMNAKNLTRNNVDLDSKLGLCYLVGYIKGGPEAVKFSIETWDQSKYFATKGKTWEEEYEKVFDTDRNLFISNDGFVKQNGMAESDHYLMLNGKAVKATDTIIDGARYSLKETVS